MTFVDSSVLVLALGYENARIASAQEFFAGAFRFGAGEIARCAKTGRVSPADLRGGT